MLVAAGLPSELDTFRERAVVHCCPLSKSVKRKNYLGKASTVPLVNSTQS